MSLNPDGEGMIQLLEEVEPVLSDLPPDTTPDSLPQSLVPITVSPDEEWVGDPTGTAWEKVRRAFLSGKKAFSIKAYASNMTEAAWLDMALRMAPKQVEVSQLQITAVRIELPPAEGMADGSIIEVDIPV